MVAVLLQRLTRGLATDIHRAASSGVQSHLVAVLCLVGSLHNVDLPIVGPVGVVGEPESRPCPAAVGSVLNVKDEEAVVVSCPGLDADGEAASGCVWFIVGADGCVDAEDGGV